MSKQDDVRLSNQIHDMIEKENLILSDGQNSNDGPLIGKVNNEEMFSNSRNNMHNYVNELVSQYNSDNKDIPSNKKSSGILLKLLLFALVVAAVIFIYNYFDFNQ